jgi:hypothetical protein
MKVTKIEFDLPKSVDLTEEEILFFGLFRNFGDIIRLDMRSTGKCHSISIISNFGSSKMEIENMDVFAEKMERVSKQISEKIKCLMVWVSFRPTFNTTFFFVSDHYSVVSFGHDIIREVRNILGDVERKEAFKKFMEI